MLTLESGWRSGPEFAPDTNAARAMSSSYSAAFSPNSTLVAAVGMEAWPSVWNARTGEVVANLRSGDLMTSDIAFSADGVAFL
jgi:WD40 repeat protein